MSGTTPLGRDLFNSQDDLAGSSPDTTIQREVNFVTNNSNNIYQNSTPSETHKVPGSNTGKFVNLSRLKRNRGRGRRLEMATITPVRERAIQAHLQRYRDEHEGAEPPPELEVRLRADPDPRMKTLAELVFEFREAHGVDPPEATMEEWLALGAVPRGYTTRTETENQGSTSNQNSARPQDNSRRVTLNVPSVPSISLLNRNSDFSHSRRSSVYKRGARVDSESSSDEEPEPRPDPRAPTDRTPFSQDRGLMVMTVPIKDVPTFSNIKGDDPRVFISKYERLSSSWSNRARVRDFAQYLEGPAADWFSVLEKDLKGVFALDDEGVQSTAWMELTWHKLKSLFEKEFAEDKAKEILKRNQEPGETGLTYFYKMVNLHTLSGLDLTEKQLAALIVQHMQEEYRG